MWAKNSKLLYKINPFRDQYEQVLEFVKIDRPLKDVVTDALAHNHTATRMYTFKYPTENAGGEYGEDLYIVADFAWNKFFSNAKKGFVSDNKRTILVGEIVDGNEFRFKLGPYCNGRGIYEIDDS